MSPKVSIIIPCYKVEKHLDRCLSSIVNQTLIDIEIILVEDKSPDKTAAKCDEWVQKDTRIKVVHKQVNEGAGLARNTGLQIATGTYVAFLDSDDFIDRRMMKDLYQYSIDNDLDCAFCGFNFWHNENNIVQRKERDYEICESKEDLRQVLLDMVGSKPDAHSDAAILTALWKGIYKREVLTKNNIVFVSERDYAAEDFIFFIDFVPCCKKIGFIPQCYYYYCDNQDSITRSYQPKRFQMEIELYSIVEARLKELGFTDDEYRNRLDRYLQLKIRACIAQQAHFIPQYGYAKMRSAANAIINDTNVRAFVNRFPYRKLHLKHKIFFLLLKYKFVDVLLLILK